MSDEAPRQGTMRANRSLMLCPHCNSASLIRNSDRVTPVAKDLYMNCLNTDCGHTWKAQISIVHTLSPSAMPDPEIDIPMAPPEYQRRKYPSGARQPGDDPGDPNQITIFDHLGRDEAA